MIDYENKQEGFNFGDLVRYRMVTNEHNEWHYLIYVNQDDEYHILTDGKGHFQLRPIVDSLERIGSSVDKNIIDLMNKGD